MIEKTFDYKPGKELIIHRSDIKNDNSDILFPGSTGTIKLGNLISDEGGEGKVYLLNSIKSTELEEDLSNVFVAKIYLDFETANSKKTKILAMLDMLHNFIGDESLNNVCWPYYAIYDGSIFVGYIMPKAIGKTLANLFYPDILNEFPQYSRKELVEICQNIIDKFEQLHAHKIIIGDINEDNFIINSPKEIYFIDTDSYQLEKYPCKVERLEYKAPELIENDDNKLTLNTEGYSTAVLIFKVLMLGKYPFTSKHFEEYSVEERILKGLFPYSIDKSITDKLAPWGFYSYIWNDFSKNLKMFFINIFTRAENVESVKVIKKYLDEYEDIISNHNKNSLIPVEFKASFEKPKLAEEKPEKQTELTKLKIAENKSKEEQKLTLPTKNKLPQIYSSKINFAEMNAAREHIIKVFEKNEIKKSNNSSESVQNAVTLLNLYLPHKIREKSSTLDDSHIRYTVTCTDLGLDGKTTSKSRDGLKFAHENLIQNIYDTKYIYIFPYNRLNKIILNSKTNNQNTKRLEFLNSENDIYSAKIDSIKVFSFDEKDKINSIEFSKNNSICAFRDKTSQQIIVITLGNICKSQNSPELKYYQFENAELLETENGLIYIYDIDEAEITTQTDCKFADILMPYYDYYSLCLKELENKNDIQKMTIDLDFLHDYYYEIDNLTADHGSSLIPIIDKTYKFKEVQIECTLNNNVESYPFYGGEIQLLDEEATNDIYSQLKEQNIEIPKNVSFVRFNYSDLGDKEQYFIESLIASGNYDKIQIGYNIIGEITRIKRVIDGIEKCLLGDVTNSKLVELICSNNTNEIISNFIDSNKYTPNKLYLKELKSKYRTIKDNEEQLKAIDKIVQMDNNDYDLLLVQGPPGTGKTELILSLIKELYHLDYKVLVTSNVQVACDNIVDRLINNRNIPLKRYSTNKGERYKKEILYNEQKYINNQVLAGYMLSLDNEKVINITLDSRESYMQLLNVKKEFDDKISIIEAEKQEYIKSLNEYNNLILEREDKNSLLEDLSEKINKIEEDYNSTNTEAKKLESEIEKSINTNKKTFDKLNKLKDKNEEEALKNKESEKDYTSLFKKLFDFKENEIHIKESLGDKSSDNISLDYLKKSLTNQISLLERINLIDTSFVYNQLKSYAEYGNFENEYEYPSNFFYEIFDEIIPIIDSGNKIKQIVSTDTDFLEKDKLLSSSNFKSIYFMLKENTAYRKIFDKKIQSYFKDGETYHLVSSFKKSIYSVAPFAKLEGKPYKIYQEEIRLLNDEFKKIFYSFDSIIKEIAEEKIYENKISIKKDKILKNINELENKIKIIEERNEQRKKELSETSVEIVDIANEIENLIKESNKNIDKLEKSTEKYNSFYAIYSSANEDIELKKEQLKNINRTISERFLELENIRTQYETEKNSYIEIENKINFYNEENKELIENFDNLIHSKDVVILKYQKCLDFIKSVIDLFSDKVQTLVSSGWTINDAENMLFNYVSELKKISEINIDKDYDEFEFYIKGQGTAFREMFELNDTGKGSIISMTTNQVASLLQSTTNDELTFDYAIIDEASKCTFEDIVISLPRVKHLILIGDFMQLDKFYDKYDRIDLKYQNILSYELWNSLNSSVFYQCLSAVVNYNDEKKLHSFDNNPMVAVMKNQYRMNKGIFELVKPIYDIHKEFELIDKKQNSFNDLLCIQIDGNEDKHDKSSFNLKEVLAITRILNEIAEHRDTFSEIKKIGVITGYRAQENEIRKNLKGIKKIDGLEIGTFDRFQGREYDLVLMSLVRTEKLGFNKYLRRMNVAISRAKKHLIIFGNFDKLLNARDEEENEEDFETNRNELEFVKKVLIPKLYDLKKKYPSEEAMKKSVIKFLKEEKR